MALVVGLADVSGAPDVSLPVQPESAADARLNPGQAGLQINTAFAGARRGFGGDLDISQSTIDEIGDAFAGLAGSVAQVTERLTALADKLDMGDHVGPCALTGDLIRLAEDFDSVATAEFAFIVALLGGEGEAACMAAAGAGGRADAKFMAGIGAVANSGAVGPWLADQYDLSLLAGPLGDLRAAIKDLQAVMSNVSDFIGVVFGAVFEPPVDEAVDNLADVAAFLSFTVVQLTDAVETAASLMGVNADQHGSMPGEVPRFRSTAGKLEPPALSASDASMCGLDFSAGDAPSSEEGHEVFADIERHDVPAALTVFALDKLFSATGPIADLTGGFADEFGAGFDDRWSPQAGSEAASMASERLVTFEACMDPADDWVSGMDVGADPDPLAVIFDSCGKEGSGVPAPSGPSGSVATILGFLDDESDVRSAGFAGS